MFLHNILFFEEKGKRFERYITCLAILLKLDFEKAYDTIDWVSMDMVLKEMGFGEKLRKWVRVCITTPRISILFNGFPCKPFKWGEGLDKGIPYHLFCLC